MVPYLKLTKKHRFLALALAFLCLHPRSLGSETLTLTTYYPAPYGGYVALMTTGGSVAAPVNTLLARDAGKVGIGTASPDKDAMLDVVGNAKVSTVILTPSKEPATPVEGMLYMEDDGSMHRYWDGAWGRLLIASTELIGKAELAQDTQISTKRETIGVKVEVVSSQAGLYQISWGGNVKIDSLVDNLVSIQVWRVDVSYSYYKTRIVGGTYYDTESSGRDGTFTTHEIDGTTLIQLRKGTTVVRMEGIKTSSNKKPNDS